MSSDDKFKDLFSGKTSALLGRLGDTPSPDIAPPEPSKLTRTKMAWAEEKRESANPPAHRRASIGAGKRLPKGQHVPRGWPVLDLGVRPLIPLDQWEIRIQGQVDDPITLDWAGFQALPQTRLTTDIHCVTTWSTFDNRWGGVAGVDLVDLVKPKDSVKHVFFHAHDGYTTTVPLEHFTKPESLIVHSWNEEPLERDHGGPARVVIPSLYFWKSAKWVRQITFSDAYIPGYWEARGYHPLGDPWREQRYE